MRAMPLQFLTWGTIAAAVGSAAWLSSTDQGALICSVGYRATSRAMGFDDDIALPDEPGRAGTPAKSPQANVVKQAPSSAS